jgi:dipeptidyl aminopeptidase/acylaminoacyl peptidase
VLYDRQRAGSRLSDRWRVRAAAGAEAEIIADEDLPFASARGGVFNDDRSKKAFGRSGDIFVRDMESGALTQITRTAAGEGSPLWMTDGSLAFRRDGVWVIRDAETGGERQAADIRTTDDPEETERKGKEKDRDYLTEQQHRLFEIVRDREARSDARDEQRRGRREADATRVPGPFYLGKGWRVHARALSPSGDWLALTVSKDPGRAERDEMPAYINEDGSVSTSGVRAKVGLEKRRSDSVVLIDLVNERVHRMDPSGLPTITEDPLAWLKEKKTDSNAEDAEGTEEGSAGDEDPAEAGAATGDESDGEADREEDEAEGEDNGKADGKPRAFMVEDVEWSRDGAGVFFVLHSHDNKDRWIATADLEALGEREDPGDEPSEVDDARRLTTIHHLRDEAWINWRYNEAGWTRDSSAVWYLSEESGKSRLYRWERATDETVCMTSGRVSLVQGVVEAPDGSFFFRMGQIHTLESRSAGPGYSIGRAWMQATDSPFIRSGAGPYNEVVVSLLGTAESFSISPNGMRIAFLHSTAMDPPEIYVQDLEEGAEPTRLTDTATALFRSFDWVAPRFKWMYRLKNQEIRSEIPCRVYDDMSVPAPSDRGKPVVVFSHGAGYTQHVYDGWSYYFREHMFHTLLCRKGYIVIAPDFRASAGYGRDWRTAIYRNMGRPELEDFDDCLAWLDSQYNQPWQGGYYNPDPDAPEPTGHTGADFDLDYGVDLDNVGIYGGSYGGFMTLMAMFLRPEVYDCGAALRSVTDWAHYNHSYTSNILNTPEVDPEAYERSSPIEHAEHLEGALLMCHGMLDDNVVAQDTIRLAQRLIELEKENWEMALYPVEPHGFREPSGWLDEYRRIFRLFETHLKD